MKMTGKFMLASAIVVMGSGAAMAADLYTPPPPAPAAIAPAATDWDGPYLGASVGYGWASVGDNTAADSTTANGWLLGGQLGYNFHLSDTIVAGLEGDLDWNNQQGGFTGADAGDTYRIKWDGSIRGRLGLDFDGVLPYVEAGVAFANADLQTPAAGTFNNTHTGWTAGGGVEFKVADPVSVNVEYRYSDYGDATYGGNSVHLNNNIVKLGVNYHF